MQGFFNFVKSLGAARMAAMAAVTLALIGFFSFLMIRMTTPQMVPLFTDLAARRQRGHRQGPRPPGHRLRAQERRLDRDGGARQGRATAHEARRKRPAQGRRRRLRDLRQVRSARHHHLHPEYQQAARARRRARAHHPQPRPRAGRARASGAAGPAAVLARQDRSVRLDRAQGARRAGAAAGTRHPPPGGDRGERAQARAHLDRRRNRQAARRRRRAEQPRRRRRRRPQDRLRKAHAQPGRDHRLLDRRPRPRARRDQRRFRPEPHHPDLGQIRSGRPRGALEPDPRGAVRRRRQRRRRGLGRQRIARLRRQKQRRRRRQRPEPQDRGNRQLRNFPHHQDRGDRGRPRQPHLRGGPGRRHLQQERQGRDRLPAAPEGRDRPHRRAGALGDRLRRQARRPGRGGQPALCRPHARCRSASRPAG